MKLKSKILLGAFATISLAAIPTTIALTTTSCGSSSSASVAADGSVNGNPDIIYKPSSFIKTKIPPQTLEQMYKCFKLSSQMDGGPGGPGAEIMKDSYKVELLDDVLQLTHDVTFKDKTGTQQHEIVIDKCVLTPDKKYGLYTHLISQPTDPNDNGGVLELFTLFDLAKYLLFLSNIDKVMQGKDYFNPPQVTFNPSPTVWQRFGDKWNLFHLFNGFLKVGLKEAAGKGLTTPFSSGTIALKGSQLLCTIEFGGTDASNNKQTFTNEYRYELAPNASGQYEYGLKQSYGDNAGKEVVSNLTYDQLDTNLNGIDRIDWPPLEDNIPNVNN